jgi:(p)ppGpp synthase/HD superfamily hydrolase
MTLIGIARTLAERAHEGVMDRNGQAYIGHPQRVAAHPDLETDEERAAAWLHDVVEDTPISLDHLALYRLPQAVLEMVDLLTRREGQTYDAFITRLIASGNRGAMRVKLADLMDNSDPSRGPVKPTQIQRYTVARGRLVQALAGGTSC